MTYKNYLHKIKKEKTLIVLTQYFLLLTIIFLWQYLSDKNIIDSFITSSPKNIIKTLFTLYNENDLFIHIITTLKETIISFIITCLLSLIIAVILYYNNFIYKVLEPYLTILNSLPKVALGPIIIIWMGANIKSVITISVLISIIISIQTIYNGFSTTDELKIKLLKTFNANKKEILFYLVLPSNKKTIINTFKINISMCLIGVITGEFLTSKAGIGYLILYGSQVFNLDLVMSGIIILVILSIVLYYMNE